MLRNQRGFSMMEAVIAAGLVGAIGVAALTLWETQYKTELGQTGISELSKDLYILRSFIEDPVACEMNFKGKELGTKINSLLNANGAVVISTSNHIGREAYKLESIEIGSHDPKSLRTEIILLLSKNDSKGRSQSTYRKFYIMTKIKDKAIEACIDPLTMTAEGSLVKGCADADPEKKYDCEKVLFNMALEVKKNFCGNHPYFRFNPDTGKCYPFDAARNCSSGYIRGYGAVGNLLCYLGPGKPAVLPGSCAEWGDWFPAESTVCKGIEMYQKRFCKDLGFSARDTRINKGTKPDCDSAI